MKRSILPGICFLAMVSCGPNYIVNTKVEDTPNNRLIADLVEHYREAIQQRDVSALKEIVSRKYFSNAGTTSEAGDDYGYEQLEKRVLPMLQENVKSVQYTLVLKKITFMGETRAAAEFEYQYKYFYVEAGKERWSARNDYNKLEFALEDGVWRITSGL